MDGSKEGLWREPCHVYTHDADATGRMTFAAIARYFQEAAWHSAEALGFGYQKATELNQFWVLVRQCIRMDRFPAWGADVVVETWPRGVSGLWAFREYMIRDGNGEAYGGASSSWMIMDANSHRPLKPEIVAGAMSYVIDRKAIGKTAGKVECPGPWEFADRRTVRFSDMDVNGHMNNSRFIDWIMDSLRKYNVYEGKKELTINYLAEAMEGDTVIIEHHSSDSGSIIKGDRESDGRHVFIAEVS